MNEIYAFIRDVGPAANTAILAVMAYFLREMRTELRAMNERINGIASRTSTLEGINEGEERRK